MSGGYILYVEDDPDDIELTLMNLRPRLPGCPFAVKRDGLEALEYLREALAGDKPLPALILLDLKMPRFNGLELMRALERDERLRGLAVVCLTSSGNEKDRKEALERGAKFYFVKPVDFREYDDIAAKLRPLLSPAKTDVPTQRPGA